MATIKREEQEADDKTSEEMVPAKKTIPKKNDDAEFCKEDYVPLNWYSDPDEEQNYNMTMKKMVVDQNARLIEFATGVKDTAKYSHTGKPLGRRILALRKRALYYWKMYIPSSCKTLCSYYL